MKILFLLLMSAGPAFGQMSKQDSVWLPLAPLIGSWEGTGGGDPGTGSYTRSYAFIFEKRFIEVRNKSVYPPSENTPKGEVHEDVGYISYDKFLRKFILRQFHAEGFVNQFTLDSLSGDGRTMVFSTTAIENIPAGWRARETYTFAPDGAMTETFELSEPGKPFEVYTKVTLRRVE